jgi:RNA polymerase sigma-70 factor (ECF subfamily)
MESVESLVRLHSNELFGYLCRYLGNRTAAEDTLSEVFVRLIENFPRMGKDVQWRPWLFKVATNLAISHQRKQKVRALFHMRSRAEGCNGHDGCAELSVEVARLRGAIEKLGKRHRPVVVMRAYQDMSYEEIALALDINIGTVKSRINEAKEKLKILLGEGYEQRIQS